MTITDCLQKATRKPKSHHSEMHARYNGCVEFSVTVYCGVSLVGQDADTGEGGRQGASLIGLKDQYENELLSECSHRYGVVSELGRSIKS